MPHLLRDSPLSALSVSPRSTSDESLRRGSTENAEDAERSAPSIPPRFRVQKDAPSQASNRCLRQCGLPQGAGLFCIWLSRKARRPRLQPGTGRAVSPQRLLWPRPCILEHTAFLAQQRGRSPGAFDLSESHEQHTTPPDTRCCAIRCRDDCCCEPSSGRSSVHC
jgi:hypothetical protein